MDGPRLVLIDLDLYGAGDPALDVGTFAAHLTEQALRTIGSADALAGCVRRLEDAYAELAGEAVRRSIKAYAVPSLARHVYLSTPLYDCRRLTERLLEMSEQRVAEQLG